MSIFKDATIKTTIVDRDELINRAPRFYKLRPRPWRQASCYSGRPMRTRLRLERSADASAAAQRFLQQPFWPVIA